MTDAIRALREAVEAGELVEVNAILGRMFAADQDLPWDWISNVNSAFRGSLDAALALMKAVLPGWDYRIERHDADHFALVFRSGWMDDHVDDWEINPVSTARALLIAVLKALEATAPASQSPDDLGNQLKGDSHD
jgi:uncharacterized protein (DUF2267 family)